jgi:hypothetical protein
MLESVDYLWKLYCDREAAPGYLQPFWNCGTAITREEIKQVLDAANFNPVEACGSHYQGNRPWHIRQIAGIVNALEKGVLFEPIRLNQDDTISDGCHRLYAHWYLNRRTIEVTYSQG